MPPLTDENLKNLLLLKLKQSANIPAAPPKIQHASPQQNAAINMAQKNNDALARLRASLLASSNKITASAPATPIQNQNPNAAAPRIANIQIPAEQKQQLKDLLRKPNAEIPAPSSLAKNIEFNEQQLAAVAAMLDPEIKETCCIGAAGTGKTTVVKEFLRQLKESGRLQPYGHAHKYLTADGAGIAFVSFTNRAVRNLRRVLPPEFASNCLTIHALLEYYFEFYEEMDEESGNMVSKRRAVPARSRVNKLHGLKFIVIDEASMVGVDLFSQLFESLEDDCKIIFLGDLNQLPPVYSSAILGYKLCDPSIPTIELTKVYRQALENPILAFAHEILKNKKEEYPPAAVKDGSKNKTPHLEFRPFKKRVDWEPALHAIGLFFQKAVEIGQYDPDEDCILIPFNKQFGTLELNKYIAQKLSEMQEKPVYEIFSGYLKHYFSIGDRIIFGKYEGRITEIVRNSKYHSSSQPRPESVLMDRWGQYRKANSASEHFKFELEASGNADEGTLGSLSEEAIDALLDSSKRNEDAKRQASHIIQVEIAETGQIMNLSEAGEINSILLAYALTVHKSQGAEWKRVFFILHGSHANMLSRELLYTGVTRAREQLYIICEPDSIQKGIERQRIKGQTLKEKAEWFKGKQDEMQRKEAGVFNFNGNGNGEK